MNQNPVSIIKHTPLSNEKELLSAVLTDEFELTHRVDYTSKYSFREIIEGIIDNSNSEYSLHDRILYYHDYENSEIFPNNIRRYHQNDFNRITNLVMQEIYSHVLNDVELVNLALQSFVNYAEYLAEEEQTIIPSIEDILAYDYLEGWVPCEFDSKIDLLIEEIGTRIFLEEVEKKPEIGKIPDDVMSGVRNKEEKLSRIINMVKSVKPEDIDLLERYLLRKTR